MSGRSLVKKTNRWGIDFTAPPKQGRLRTCDLPSPVGYSERSAGLAQADADADSKLLSKRSWNIALAPIKQLPMNLFMMYMAGSSISIFPIMIVGMMIFRPIKALLAYGGTFKMLNDSEAGQSALQKIAWIVGNLGAIAVALYKCHSMGLLPTSPSDWLAFKEHRTRMEYIIGGQVF